MSVHGPSKNAGFSLVELMVVVGIIGILAAIAVPKLQMFSAKAKRTEAQITLKHAHTLQTSYYAENSGYGNATQIGYNSDALKNYQGTVNLMNPTTTKDGYNAYAQLKSNVKLCPGQTSGGFATRDFWYVGDCPSGISTCGGLLGQIQSSNPNFSFNGVPQPAVPDLLNSCR